MFLGVKQSRTLLALTIFFFNRVTQIIGRTTMYMYYVLCTYDFSIIATLKIFIRDNLHPQSLFSELAPYDIDAKNAYKSGMKGLARSCPLPPRNVRRNFRSPCASSHASRTRESWRTNRLRTFLRINRVTMPWKMVYSVKEWRRIGLR